MFQSHQGDIWRYLNDAKEWHVFFPFPIVPILKHVTFENSFQRLKKGTFLSSGGIFVRAIQLTCSLMLVKFMDVSSLGTW